MLGICAVRERLSDQGRPSGDGWIVSWFMNPHMSGKSTTEKARVRTLRLLVNLAKSKTESLTGTGTVPPMSCLSALPEGRLVDPCLMAKIHGRMD